MNLETKITIYKFTPQVFTLTHYYSKSEKIDRMVYLVFYAHFPELLSAWTFAYSIRMQFSLFFSSLYDAPSLFLNVVHAAESNII